MKTNFIRHKCANLIGKAILTITYSNSEAVTVKHIRKKLRSDDLILCKADKDNSLTILSKTD